MCRVVIVICLFRILFNNILFFSLVRGLQIDGLQSARSICLEHFSRDHATDVNALPLLEQYLITLKNDLVKLRPVKRVLYFTAEIRECGLFYTHA
jgi:hypothetical protein